MHNGSGEHAQYRRFSCTTGAVNMLIRARRIHISTEFSLEELLQLDEALASRIIQRAGDNIVVVKNDPHKNFRLQNVLEL